MDVVKKQLKDRKQREHDPDKKSKPVAKEWRSGSATQEARNGGTLEEWSAQPEDGIDSPYETSSSQSTHRTAFAVLLGSLLKNDRSEILRVAKEIGVSDNTVYRWLNAASTPRYNHLQRLLEVLNQPSPASPASFLQSMHQNSSRGMVGPAGHWDVPQDLYRRVIEQAATTTDDASRRWHIIETIFEQALLFLDPDRHGMALTYARLMPPRADSRIHSLYETEMRGQAPWPFALDFKTYLGSTTLAGLAAMSQRVHTWSANDKEARIPVGLDEDERSSCAAPVIRGGRLAGVLTVSSADPDFVSNPVVLRVVGDYANLLAIGLMDSDTYPIEIVKLVPMPDLPWQRVRISSSYLNRVIECARKQCLSFPEAEQKVLRDMEEEFEIFAANHPNDVTQSETAVKKIEQIR
jgi:transcriptional regulator with XRE-family HTH domain